MPAGGSVFDVNAPFWNIEEISIDGQGKDRILVNINHDHFSLKNSKLFHTLSSAIEVKGSNITVEHNDLFMIDKLNAWFFAPILYILLTVILVIALCLSLSYRNILSSKILIAAIIMNLLFFGWLVTQGSLFFQNKDAHGVLVWPGSSAIVINENNISQLSGDGIQVINDFKGTGLPAAEGIAITNNRIAAARENCVDIKTSRSVVIEGNACSGVLPSQTSWGEGIIIHSNAQNITLKDNIIYRSRNGITVTKGAVTNDPEEYPRMVMIQNNTITELVAPDHGFGSGSGILAGEGDDIRIENNKVYGASDFAFGLTKDGTSKTIVLQDNIFTGTIALHLPEKYEERIREASGNIIQGKIRIGGAIRDNVQDASLNSLHGFASRKGIEKDYNPLSNADWYANRNRETWVMWSQWVWLGMIILTIFTATLRKR